VPRVLRVGRAGGFNDAEREQVSRWRLPTHARTRGRAIGTPGAAGCTSVRRIQTELAPQAGQEISSNRILLPSRSLVRVEMPLVPGLWRRSLLVESRRFPPFDDRPVADMEMCIQGRKTRKSLKTDRLTSSVRSCSG
jgi:hypothetical protein